MENKIIILIMIVFLTGFGFLFGYVYGIMKERRRNSKIIENITSKYYKFQSYYNVMNGLWQIKNQSASLEKYLLDLGYSSIAIYGFGTLGRRFHELLRDSRIIIDYVIDQNASEMMADLRIVNPKDDFPETKAIIVTAVFDYDKIAMELMEKVSTIISLELIVSEIVSQT